MNGREDFWIDAIDTSVSHSCHVMFHCLITAGLEPWLVLGKTCHSCFGVLLHLPRSVALGILLAVHHLWHPIPIGPPLSYCIGSGAGEARGTIELFYTTTCWTLTSSGRQTCRKASGFGIPLRFDFVWTGRTDLGAETGPETEVVDVVVDEGLIYQNLSPNLIQLVAKAPQGLLGHQLGQLRLRARQLGLKHLSREDLFFK